MSLKAVSFKILVQPDEPKEMSEGGIDLSALDKKMEKNAGTTGVIVDIGEDAFKAFKPNTMFAGLKIGDRVHYPKYAGKWLQDSVTKEEVLAINDEDVIAKEEQSDSNKLASK